MYSTNRGNQRCARTPSWWKRRFLSAVSALVFLLAGSTSATAAALSSPIDGDQPVHPPSQVLQPEATSLEWRQATLAALAQPAEKADGEQRAYVDDYLAEEAKNGRLHDIRTVSITSLVVDGQSLLSVVHPDSEVLSHARIEKYSLGTEEARYVSLSVAPNSDSDNNAVAATASTGYGPLSGIDGLLTPARKCWKTYFNSMWAYTTQVRDCVERYDAESYYGFSVRNRYLRVKPGTAKSSYYETAVTDVSMESEPTSYDRAKIATAPIDAAPNTSYAHCTKGNPYTDLLTQMTPSPATKMKGGAGGTISFILPKVFCIATVTPYLGSPPKGMGLTFTGTWRAKPLNLGYAFGVQAKKKFGSTYHKPRYMHTVEFTLQNCSKWDTCNFNYEDFAEIKSKVF